MWSIQLLLNFPGRRKNKCSGPNKVTRTHHYIRNQRFSGSNKVASFHNGRQELSLMNVVWTGLVLLLMTYEQVERLQLWNAFEVLSLHFEQFWKTNEWETKQCQFLLKKYCHFYVAKSMWEKNIKKPHCNLALISLIENTLGRITKVKCVAAK